MRGPVAGGPAGLAGRSPVRLLLVSVVWLVVVGIVFAPAAPDRATAATATEEPVPTLISGDVSTDLVPPRFEASGYPPAPEPPEVGPAAAEVPDAEDPPAALPSVDTQPRPALGAELAVPVESSPITANLLIPAIALSAYRTGEAAAPELGGGCRVPWQVLAGIGRVESGHGTFGGASGSIASDGTFAQRIVGPALTGAPGVARIRDTDGGRWDGDDEWDRAVGPMQFIPTSWLRFGNDGNGDGIADPHNFYDATVSAAAHLCGTVPGDYRTDQPRLAQALFRYNNSAAYVSQVLGWIGAYLGLDASADEEAPPAVPPPEPRPAAEPEPERVVAFEEPEPAPAPSRDEPAPEPVEEPAPTPTPVPSELASAGTSPLPAEPASPAPTGGPLPDPTIAAGDVAVLEPDGEATSTPTPGPGGTPMPAPSGDASETPAPEPTGTPTVDGSETPAPEPTGTPTADGSETPAPEPTGIPTADASETPAPEPTGTPTAESRETPSPAPGATPSPWPDPTGTPEPDASATPWADPSTPEPGETETPRPDAEPTQPEWAPAELEILVAGSDEDRPEGLRVPSLADYVQRLVAAINDADERTIIALVSGVEDDDEVVEALTEERDAGGELAAARLIVTYPDNGDDPVELEIAVWRRLPGEDGPDDEPKEWAALELTAEGKVRSLTLTEVADEDVPDPS